MITLAIVGRPNVGKSTFYNKLTLGKKTIVHDLPGVTRDFSISLAQLGDLKFNLIDSAGLYENPTEQLDKNILKKTQQALENADILLFMVDAHSGVKNQNFYFAKFLRKLNKPIILLINKCDGKKFQTYLDDFDKLGFNTQVCISAEHKIGFAELLLTIKELAQKLNLNLSFEESKPNIDIIKLAIIGKPNTGKSTFINKLINSERLLTGEEAGVTRDSISINLNYKNYQFSIIDTAGLRRRKNIDKDSIEQYAVSQTISVVNTANIVILMNDINEPLQKQDLKIAEFAIKEGKPIIIIYNKIDSFKNLDKIRPKLDKYTHEIINDIKDISIFYLSALKDNSFNYILDQAIKLYKLWNIEISKKELNLWLEYATNKHQPPLSKTGRRIKLKYIIQSATRPPTFKIFVNIVENLPKSYIKYLINDLQTSFNIKGVPIRIEVKKNFNPYEK
jgi:GTP-binding protein